ncbi:hypothetical protein VP01_1393g7 [Puccinia sorghi]|uniref:Uncharacterized protein n=1 Tax=Puccinia sorghi TaxID=27349 RepID=A0A0L6VN02_9BASI|nr:hypothetical protein VP01_1393g7 [Puccinia sorghi]
MYSRFTCVHISYLKTFINFQDSFRFMLKILDMSLIMETGIPISFLLRIDNHFSNSLRHSWKIKKWLCMPSIGEAMPNLFEFPVFSFLKKHSQTCFPHFCPQNNKPTIFISTCECFIEQTSINTSKYRFQHVLALILSNQKPNNTFNAEGGSYQSPLESLWKIG